MLFEANNWFNSCNDDDDLYVQCSLSCRRLVTSVSIFEPIGAFRMDVSSCIFPGGLQSPAFDSWRVNSSGLFSANYPPPPPSAMMHGNAHFASIAPPITSLPYHQRPTTVSPFKRNIHSFIHSSKLELPRLHSVGCGAR